MPTDKHKSVQAVHGLAIETRPPRVQRETYRSAPNKSACLPSLRSLSIAAASACSVGVLRIAVGRSLLNPVERMFPPLTITAPTRCCLYSLFNASLLAHSIIQPYSAFADQFHLYAPRCCGC